jgi:hypothetical protein
MTRPFAWSSGVGRGGIEPPTFRFSGSWWYIGGSEAKQPPLTVGLMAEAGGVCSVGRGWDTGATEGTSYAGSRVGAVRGVGDLSGVEPEIG